MTIKALIKILKTYNQNAEVRVIIDRQRGDTCPATMIQEICDPSASNFGFAAKMFKEERKKSKKIVIG